MNSQPQTIERIAAIIYALLTAGVVVFQLALATGAPWGEYAMGGALPGAFPPAMRIAAVVQAALLAGLALIVSSRAGLILPGWSRVSRWLIWVVATILTLSLIMNLITPSAGERAIWAPVILVLLACCVAVGLVGNRKRA